VGGDWQLLKRALGGKFGGNGTFDIDELPVADVTLMSTFHYYIDINAWMKYVDRLAAKTCAVVIVSRPKLDNGHWMAQADYLAISGYFGNWREIGAIADISSDGDSKPRDLYSVIFESPLIRRVPIADIDIRESEGDAMQKAMRSMAGIAKMVRHDDFDPMNTEYATLWRERKANEWSERTLRIFVNGKWNVMRSIRDEGQRDPIIVQRDGLKLSDGGHRLAMLKALGYQSAIVREI
jgi:hypothetical protein